MTKKGEIFARTTRPGHENGFRWAEEFVVTRFVGRDGKGKEVQHRMLFGGVIIFVLLSTSRSKQQDFVLQGANISSFQTESSRLVAPKSPPPRFMSFKPEADSGYRLCPGYTRSGDWDFSPIRPKRRLYLEVAKMQSSSTPVDIRCEVIDIFQCCLFPITCSRKALRPRLRV